MHKFLGILFFYTVAFYEKKRKYDSPFAILNSYLNEKCQRYLNLKNITESQWEILKREFKDYPAPMDDNNYLKNEHIIGIISVFDEVFGIKNIEYELRMYGIPEENEEEIIRNCFDNLKETIEIIGSSNGIHILLGDWISNSEFDIEVANREISLIELTDIFCHIE